MLHTSFDPTDDGPTPTDAHALIARTRARMVARAATPWWYPITYGAGVGGLAASLALPVHLAPLGLAVCLSVLLAGYAAWQAHTGLRVSGWRAGATRRIARRMGLIMLGVIALAGLSRARGGSPLIPVALGVLLGVIAAQTSKAWDRAWRADMLSGEGA